MTLASAERQLHFNAFLMGCGHHEAAWRLPASDPFANLDLGHWTNLARIAERGAFDSVFLADGPVLWGHAKYRPGGSLEPTVLLTALAGVTSHIGLIATASTTYNAPYNLARRFASLDHISGGRAGWNIVTTAGKAAAQNFGLDDLAAGQHQQTVDLGEQYQMVLELRPSHDPEQTWGFVGVVVSTEDLSASVWRWSRQDGSWRADKVITIPAEPADQDTLPPALKPFGAVPPLVTDINLSVDDQFLYVSCWGIGELKQYDVSDPAHPREVGSVRLGGITGRVAHPAAPAEPLAGGPQMVEVSRDGKRIYLTNSLYGSWDDQFYPDGVGSWLAKIDTDPAAGGGLSLDEKFFPRGEAWRGRRVHQVRLGGGDASSDSYCYRS